MFETASQLLKFFIQIGVALAGAASLWGFVLGWKYLKNTERQTDIIGLIRILFVISLVGFVIFSVAWWFSYSLFFTPEISAHEGIVVKPIFEEIVKGFSLNFPVVIVASIFMLWGIWLYLKKKLSGKKAFSFFFVQFVLLSIIIILSAFKENLEKEQIFFFLHGWHSILTLGTVITVDILYLLTLGKENLKRVLYPFYPFMSIAIWIGLGIDFASVLIILPEALNVTEQFFFNQTVVAIIILNGAFLSGKMNDKLISLIRPDKVLPLPTSTNLLFGISGSVSIVSWLTITFLDFFAFGFSYLTFIGIYAAVIIIAFFAQKIAKTVFTQKHLSPI